MNNLSGYSIPDRNSNWISPRNRCADPPGRTIQNCFCGVNFVIANSLSPCNKVQWKKLLYNLVNYRQLNSYLD
jgi:hypothetical protein